MPNNFEELRRLAEAATEGPWEYDARYAQLTTDRRPPMLPLMSVRQGKWIIADLSNSWTTDDEQLNADGEFLAACREGVPALLAELDRQANEIAALRAEVARLAARWSHAAAAAYSDDEFRMGAER